MITDLYVAEDGTIHRNPVTGANNVTNHDSAYSNRPADNIREDYRSAEQPSPERIAWFWLVSIIVSVLIGIGVNECFGMNITESEGDFLTAIAPYVVIIGSLTGSILYGIYCAKKVDYNLWAYVLSAISSIGGIIGTVLAVGIIYAVVMICLYILAIAFIIGIICAVLGGS